ncbi:MAG: SOS response-associated peptidase [Coriobacteriia bacterium]|nr:SOS response-associated peptidase [Coriobacteriia bacterium]
MCGRYVVDIDKKVLDEILEEVKSHTVSEAVMMTVKMEGEIFPTDTVPIRMIDGYQIMRWGFRTDKRNVINARSETAMEKPMFRQSMIERRCLIVASGYYEWKQGTGGRKIKYEFSLLDNSLFYLAGCYRTEHESSECSFVILTREATPEFSSIHDRMPVVFTSQQADRWLEAKDSNITELMEQSTTELKARVALK